MTAVMSLPDYMTLVAAVQESGFDTGWHDGAAEFVTELLSHIEPHGHTVVPIAEIARLRTIEIMARALVDAWHSGEEGPLYLALQEAVYG